MQWQYLERLAMANNMPKQSGIHLSRQNPDWAAACSYGFGDITK